VQYASTAYCRALERHGIEQSMSRRGNCFDNVNMESFFASRRKERVHQVRFPTREEARAAVFDYVEVVPNRQLLLSALAIEPRPKRARIRARSTCPPQHNVLISSLHLGGKIQPGNGETDAGALRGHDDNQDGAGS
jgi:hypothetical protein